MGAPAPAELTKWELAEHFPGWTLEYIGEMSIQNIHEYYQIKDAKIKARVR